ncbi:MAG: hypothetical protein M3Q95_06450 [Bacteroidota bacterium]|nr:hypothetical protein [Bacteroidota bacterium]
MKFRCIYFRILTLLMLVSSQLLSQDRDPEGLLERVQNKFRTVMDYEAEVTIKVDVDFIKIPLKKGTIWYLQPDKIKVKTPGFALLPKRGMNFSPNQLFTGNYVTIYAREEKVGNVMTTVIKVIPQDEKDEIILSTLWIDPVRNVILRLESTTKTDGTFAMQFIYDPVAGKYDLPREIIFNFDLRKSELPIGLTGDFENSAPKEKGPKNTRGTVTINYVKYIINEGKGNAAFKTSKK